MNPTTLAWILVAVGAFLLFASRPLSNSFQNEFERGLGLFDLA